MKRVLAVTAAVALLALTSCVIVHVPESSAHSAGELKAVANAGQTGELPATVKILEVDNRSGFIRVIGIESGPAEWVWKLTARARSDELAQQAAQAATCKAEGDGDKFRIAITMPDSQGNTSFQSDLEIRAPKSVTIRTKNRYGRTEIADLTGDVEATSQSGAVEIRNIGGEVRVQNTYTTLKVNHTGAATLKNQSGLIEATDIRGPLDAETTYAALVARDIGGAIRLRNQSGRVEAARSGGNADIKTSYAELSVSEIKGDANLVNQSGAVTVNGISGSVKATTTYATMDLKGVGGPNLLLQNQSGSIKVQALSNTITNLEAKTSYAQLEVHLPADSKPVISAQTTYAKVESDFPVMLKAEGKDPFADAPAGVPRITLQNQSGGIRVVRD